MLEALAVQKHNIAVQESGQTWGDSIEYANQRVQLQPGSNTYRHNCRDVNNSWSIFKVYELGCNHSHNSHPTIRQGTQ